MVRPPTFTVFTPAFNRAHTLERVYRSLLAQTFTDFEWVVVDDGSSDNTKELVASWQHEAKMEIRYFYQENQGKPAAHNNAVQQARGELFVPLDSDDACRPDALERFLFHWRNIPLSERDSFSGVSCHCVDTEGHLVGTPFPTSIVDSTLIEMYSGRRVKGEKWGFIRTDILRMFPFPQFAGERYVPEGVVWNRIGRAYKIRFINEDLRIYDLDSDGITTSLVRIRARSPRGMALYYRECLDLPIPVAQQVKALINYVRSSFHAGNTYAGALRGLTTGLPSVVRLASIPVALLLFKMDRMKLRKSDRQ
jgi:glycosyltransferase involved in cell wall biosynthesis